MQISAYVDGGQAQVNQAHKTHVIKVIIIISFICAQSLVYNTISSTEN